mmetsp:Transcript_14524/g.41451  ORF Transcript_14524/g.41451 Transcript_14524/m.41451 type:complete len:254 (+) Transcript_14524:256-1017(+)
MSPTSVWLFLNSRIHSESKSLPMTSKTPSQHSTTQSPEDASHSYTSGQQLTFCSSGGRAASLYSKSPKARETERRPSTRGKGSPRTWPPAECIRSRSAGMLGLWSSVALWDPSALTRTHLASPRFATDILKLSFCVGMTQATIAVLPQDEKEASRSNWPTPLRSRSLRFRKPASQSLKALVHAPVRSREQLLEAKVLLRCFGRVVTAQAEHWSPPWPSKTPTTVPTTGPTFMGMALMCASSCFGRRPCAIATA